MKRALLDIEPTTQDRELARPAVYSPAVVARFWSKVERSEVCWLWTGAKLKRRTHHYGLFNTPRTVYVHRLAYELHYGPIPKGMVVMHTCDRPECVRPAHLVLGTQTENIADRHRKGRDKRSLTPEMAKRLYEDPRNASQLSKATGIPASTIHNIKTGRCWADVTGALDRRPG